jgi:hypothetical protein
MAPTKTAKSSVAEKIVKSVSTKSETSSGKKTSTTKLVVMPVSTEQSGLYNVKELNKQFSKLIAEATKSIVGLSEVNEETVGVAIQTALETVYSYAIESTVNGKKGKKAKKVKDPNAPKKPLSNYMVYCMRFRADLQTKNPGSKPTEISKMLGEQWNKLTPDQKAKYIDTTVSA